MRKQLFLSLAAIVFCITIPIGCNGGSSSQASGDDAAQVGLEVEGINEPEQILYHAKLTGNGINLRAGADTTNKVRCQLYENYEVGVLIDDVGNGWSKINYKDTIGFIQKKYLEPIDNKGEENVATDDGEQEEVKDTTETEKKEEVEAEATDNDTTDVADAEEEDTTQNEAVQPADTLQALAVDADLVDSLWKQMLVEVYVADDTTLAKAKQTKGDSLREVVEEKRIDTLVLKQIASEEASTVVVKKEGLPCWLAWLIGGGALLLGILLTYFIMRKPKKGSHGKGGGYVDPNSPTPQEVKALKKRADELDKDVKKLRQEVESAKRSYDDAKRKLDSAERDKQQAVQQAVKQCREEYDIVINRMQKEMKLYTERAVFFLPAQGFAQKAAAFFDALDQLQAETMRFKADVPSGVNADDYNYYLMRIERKFHTSIAKVDALSQWRRELQMLAGTGLIPAGGLIDKRMGGGKVKEQEMEGTLRMLLYQAVMNTLAGAAVVMSDEMAIMLPQMVAGVKGADAFARTTEQLKKATADMGYGLNYVKPFTPLSAYKDVQNVQFTKADVPEGTIFEVMKMAVNFGSTKSNTEVSAK